MFCAKLVFYLSLCSLSWCVGAVTTNPCEVPKAQDDINWINRHELMVSIAQTNTMNDVVWIGDGIVENMKTTSLWEEEAKMNSLNFGKSGDKIQNVLWRVLNGEFDFMPDVIKVAVIFVGTNNEANTADEIYRGIANLLTVSRRQLGRDVTIILPTLLPKGEHPNAERTKIQQVNSMMLTLNNPTNNVQVLSIGQDFIQGDDQSISKEDMADFVHPTGSGYKKAFTAVFEEIKKILVATTETDTEPPVTSSGFLVD